MSELTGEMRMLLTHLADTSWVLQPSEKISIRAALSAVNDRDALRAEIAGLREQLQTVHAHVKEALELLGVDVSVSGYVPDSWTLREQCKMKAEKLAEAERLANREPVTEEWLRSIGGKLEGTQWRFPLRRGPHQGSKWYVVVHDGVWFLELLCVRTHGKETLFSWSTVVAKSSTQSDVLNLLSALGVTVKGEASGLS